MTKNAALEEALSFDALDVAERLTGESYKTDEDTELLGLGMFFENNRRKEKMLLEAGDTPFNCTLNKQLAIALAEGFKVVLIDNFTGRKWHDETPPEETFMVLWNPEGFLMTIESYNGTGRNMAKLYYNLDLSESMATEERKYYSVTSSGGFIFDHTAPKDADGYSPMTNLWAGDHDAREAFRYTLNKLRTASPLPVWAKQPHLWLVNYGETPDHSDRDNRPDYDAINKGRIARLPQEVQDAIKGDPKYN